MEKKGQIWIETVLYSLIGLSLIALVLTFVMPKINTQKDNALIEQTIDSLNLLDEKINSIIVNGPGNIRVIEYGVGAGKLTINSEGDFIEYEMEDMKSPFSEPGVEISYGRVKVKTSGEGDRYSVVLNVNYKTRADLRYNGNDDENGQLSASSRAYRLSIENKGDANDDGIYELHIRLG